MEWFEWLSVDTGDFTKYGQPVSRPAQTWRVGIELPAFSYGVQCIPRLLYEYCFLRIVLIFFPVLTCITA